ncbi:MAG: MSMEG_0568 family radical SAM protein [Candidatus Methanofastidiosia archaeon]
MKNIAELKVRLQSLGIKMPKMKKGRRGGAGPAAGKSLIFGRTVANVPTQSWFVEQSPFKIVTDDGNYWIEENGTKIIKVLFPKTPMFYSKTTSDGIKMKKIALLHGASCLASTIYQKCAYFREGKACSFCGIELSLALRDTVEKKTPAQLAEVAKEAKCEKIVDHVTLTTGTPKTPDKGMKNLLKTCRAIKESSTLPVHIQFEPPADISTLEKMPEWDVDTVGIHIESLDNDVLQKHAPMKAAIGFEQFKNAWKKAVEVVGENQVESFIIAGLGENINTTLEKMSEMTSIGVYPFIVPLRPIPSTKLQNERPPSPDYMINFLSMASDIIKDSGLSWKKNRAGCLRCRACSALPDFE